MTIKERVMQILEYKDIAKEKFFTEIGMTSANFRGNAKTTPLNSTAIANIFAIIPDLNLVWLITGEGTMTTSSPTEKSNEFAMRIIKEKDEKIEELIRDNERKNQEIIELKKRYSVSTSNFSSMDSTSIGASTVDINNG